MNLLERFKEKVRQEQLFAEGDILLLAVSGGVDSVVLCELCQQAGYHFAIAHCNFQLRGAESDRDEEFVKKLGEKYQAEVMVKRFDTEGYAKEKKLSIQEAARELRYGWFEELIEEAIGKGQRGMGSKEISDSRYQPQTPNLKLETRTFSTHKEFPNLGTLPFAHSPFPIHLLTAHHADDNIETLLQHFLRGCGLKGLTGIPAKNGFTRRPLLSFFKEELQAFAAENRLEFVEDSSNRESKYTRNYLRNEWIPAVEKIYPQVKHNLQDNIGRFSEIEKLYRLSVEQVRNKLLKKRGTEWYVPFRELLRYNNRALVYELIAPFGFTEKQVDEVMKLAGSESGHYLQAPHSAYRIIRHRNWFVISDAAKPGAGILLLEEKDGGIQFDRGRLEIIRTKDVHAPASPLVACLDARQVRFPLLLRRWKTGDYFYPLGMKKKKKLARFFIDQKFSKTEKERAWVLESDKRVIWVLGHRIDDRVKITEATREVLRLQLIPSKEAGPL